MSDDVDRERTEFSALLPAVPASVGLLRRFTVQTMAIANSKVDDDDASLVVSELASNALEHTATSHLRVTIRVRGTGVRVEVEDGSGEAPRVNVDAPPELPSGRGLLIVERVAASWGWDADADHKVVWAWLDR